MKPMWLMLEYETSNFMSLWTSAISAPQMIAATASTGITQRQSHQSTGCGNRGTAMRRKPYAPALPITPAKVISIGVGAAAYASGSQLWNGNSGVLMAKAIAKRKNRANWVDGPGASLASCARSNVWWPVATYSPMTPTSISSEPTSV